MDVMLFRRSGIELTLTAAMFFKVSETAVITSVLFKRLEIESTLRAVFPNRLDTEEITAALFKMSVSKVTAESVTALTSGVSTRASA